MELKLIKTRQSFFVVFDIIAPLLELKHNNQLGVIFYAPDIIAPLLELKLFKTQIIMLIEIRYNCTTFGIETQITYAFITPVLRYNCTTFGIETYLKTGFFGLLCKDIIAPLLELKQYRK